jgi:CRISPR type III-B/RAMP module-associated protein Cmr3
MEAGADLSNLNRESWSKLDERLRGELGEWCEFGALELRGPWLIQNERAVMPAPADLGLVMKRHEPRETDVGPAWAGIEQVVRYRFKESRPTTNGWSHALAVAQPYCPHGKEEAEYDAQFTGKVPRPAEGWFLTVEGMQSWLAGGIPAAQTFIHKAELWVDEVRTGVGLRSDQRSGSEGMLYTFGFVRLQRPKPDASRGAGTGVGFELRNGGLGPEAFLRLGGDGRTAAAEAAKPFPHDEPPKVAGAFLLYFGTPTLSEGGAFPPGFSADQFIGEIGGARCKLAGAIIRTAQPIGGWELATALPKPLRRAIPAGSVFRFEVVERGGSLDAGSIHGHNLCGFPNEHLAQQGFGLVLVGATN